MSLFNSRIKAEANGYSRGLQFNGSYTYSKSLDYNSLSTGETYILQNAYDPRADYGLSEFDARHHFCSERSSSS